jgi:hypothetical protein
MCISGNYFERLLIKILPYTAIACAFLYPIDNDIKWVTVFAILTAILWLTEILTIRFIYKARILHTGKTFRCGRRRFSIHEIDRIIPVTAQRRRWTLDMVELHLTDGTILIIIDKPRGFVKELLEKPSGTIRRLIKKYPELEGKDERRRWE